MATTLSQFRSRFPEFSEVPDSEINEALSDAACIMDVCQWGIKYDLGQAFLAAHYIATFSTSVNSGSGSVGPITQATTGPLSVSYGMPVSNDGSDAYYNSTKYGQRYLTYRKQVGMGGLVV